MPFDKKRIVAAQICPSLSRFLGSAVQIVISMVYIAIFIAFVGQQQ